MTTTLGTTSSIKEFDDYPPPLREALRPVVASMDALSKRMERGEISVAEWRRRMMAILERAYGANLAAGFGDQFPDGENMIEVMLSVQEEYLDRFAVDVTATGWTPRMTPRARMYAFSSAAAWHVGDVARQSGGVVLPVPAYPTEGSQCGSHCKCTWVIDVIDAANNDYDAYWTLGASEHCQTCLERAAQWGPVRIRGGVLV